jgi:hypothetical protein
MSEYDQPEVPVSQFGAWLRAQHFARMQANTDAMTAASMAAHRPDHDVITAGQLGITGMSGQQAAAQVADRQVTIGSGTDSARPVLKLGGLYAHHVSSPHPPSRDLRNAGQPGGLAYDPLASLRQFRGEQ